MSTFELDPMAEDPYERLGVSPEASDLEIKKAKVKAKAKYHPDRWPDDKKDWARERFYRIQDAIEMLESDGGTASDTRSTGSGGDSRYAGSDESTGDTGDDTDGESAGDGGRDTDDDSETATSRDDPPTVRLDVSASRDRVDIGTTVAFTVEDADGEKVEDAMLSAAGVGRSKTNDEGIGELTFDSEGSFKVTADKSGSDATYISDTMRVTVDPREVDLVVEPETDTVVAGDSLLVKVFDDTGSPIDDVRLTSSVGHDVEVFGHTARLSFEDSDEGAVELTAEKEDTDAIEYSSDTIEIEVERSEVQLALEPETYSCDAGEDVNFTVYDRLSNRIDGVTVSVDGGESSETGRNGTCTLTLLEPEETTVTATKADDDGVTYLSDSVEIDVEERDPADTTSPTDRWDGSTETRAGTDEDRGDATTGTATATDSPDDEGPRLSLERDNDKPRPKEPVEFVVRDEDGDVVTDATVEVEETGHRSTAADGDAYSFTFETGGRKTVRATKEADGTVLTSNEVTVSVYSPSSAGEREPDRRTTGRTGTPDRSETYLKFLLMLAIVGLMGSFVGLVQFGMLGMVAVLAAAGVVMLVLFVYVNITES